MSSPSAQTLGKRTANYVLVAQALIADIESGRYPVDSLLPTEHELATQFGMSRHTIREAMRRLQELGMITRLQGVGTRVKSDAAAAGYVHRAGSIADLVQYARDVRLHVTASDETIADEDLAQRLGCREGQRWLHVQGLRFETGIPQPVCFTDVFIAYEFISIRDLIGKSNTAIYALIEQHFGERITEVDQKIAATEIPPMLAKPLMAEAGGAALSIERIYRSAGDRVVEAAFSLYPAGRFSYEMRLSLDAVTE
jgi:GntR family transcriptional regulator